MQIQIDKIIHRSPTNTSLESNVLGIMDLGVRLQVDGEREPNAAYVTLERFRFAVRRIEVPLQVRVSGECSIARLAHDCLVCLHVVVELDDVAQYRRTHQALVHLNGDLLAVVDDFDALGMCMRRAFVLLSLLGRLDRCVQCAAAIFRHRFVVCGQHKQMLFVQLQVLFAHNVVVAYRVLLDDGLVARLQLLGWGLVRALAIRRARVEEILCAGDFLFEIEEIADVHHTFVADGRRYQLLVGIIYAAQLCQKEKGRQICLPFLCGYSSVQHIYRCANAIVDHLLQSRGFDDRRCVKGGLIIGQA